SSIYYLFYDSYRTPRYLHSFPTRRSSDLVQSHPGLSRSGGWTSLLHGAGWPWRAARVPTEVRRLYVLRGNRHGKPCASWIRHLRSEEHTSELQSLAYLVCRLLLEKKNL